MHLGQVSTSGGAADTYEGGLGLSPSLLWINKVQYPGFDLRNLYGG